MAVHESGVQHNDVEPRNIVVKDGSPVLVDFQHATVHDCGCKTVIHEGARMPEEYDFGCYEIYMYARRACIWRTGVYIVQIIQPVKLSRTQIIQGISRSPAWPYRSCTRRPWRI